MVAPLHPHKTFHIICCIYQYFCILTLYDLKMRYNTYSAARSRTNTQDENQTTRFLSIWVAWAVEWLYLRTACPPEMFLRTSFSISCRYPIYITFIDIINQINVTHCHENPRKQLPRWFLFKRVFSIHKIESVLLCVSPNSQLKLLNSLYQTGWRVYISSRISIKKDLYAAVEFNYVICDKSINFIRSSVCITVLFIFTCEGRNIWPQVV